MFLTDQQIEDMLRIVQNQEGRSTIFSLSLEAAQTIRADAERQVENGVPTSALNGMAFMYPEKDKSGRFTGVKLTVTFDLPPELDPMNRWRARHGQKPDAKTSDLALSKANAMLRERTTAESTGLQALLTELMALEARVAETKHRFDTEVFHVVAAGLNEAQRAAYDAYMARHPMPTAPDAERGADRDLNLSAP